MLMGRSVWLWVGLFGVACGIIYIGIYMMKKPTDIKLLAKKILPVFSVPTDAIKEMRLDNGMKVLMYQCPTSPKVLVQIAYNVGSYVESEGERGLAHLIEHMIFKGTEKFAEGDIDRIARVYGASFNAFTAMDVTSYYFEAHKNNWPLFVGVLADCMQNARFDPQHLSSEIKTVMQELRMGRDKYWQKMFLKAYELAYPSHHPYHHPVIGYKEDLLHLSAAQLKSFYKKYYTPQHAVLFIMGDFEFAQAEELVKKNFSNIPANGVEIKKEFPLVMQQTLTNSTRFYEDVARDQLGFYWVIPGLTSSDEILADVIEYALGGGEGSRLYRLLVDEKKIATSVYVRALQQQKGGIFLIFVEPCEGKNDVCAELIKQELDRVMKDGITSDELLRVITNKTRAFYEQTQNFNSFVHDWIDAYFATKDKLAPFKRIQKYKDVSLDHVKKYVQKYLDPFLMNRIEVLPLPAPQKARAQDMKKSLDEIDAAILAKHQRTTKLESPSEYVKNLPAPQQLAFTFPQPDKITNLPNGLRVIVKKNVNVPLMTLICQFNDAEYLSQALEGNDSALMMDMLIEGSKNYNKRDHVSFFEQYGAHYSFGATGCSVSMLNQDYVSVLERLYTILMTPIFPHDAFEKLKTIFTDSLERSKDDQFTLLQRAMRMIVYKNHPYGWSYDQAIERVSKLTVTDMVKLHMTYLIPSNMSITIVGNDNVDTMFKMVEKVFGSWQAGSPKKALYTTGAFTTQNLDIPKMRDQVLIALCQPSLLTIAHHDIVPIKILNIITFLSIGSRLYQVREQTGLFYTAFGRFAAGSGKGPGLDYIGALVSKDALGEAEKKIREVVSVLAAKGITQDEYNEACQIYLKGLIDIVSSNASQASMFADLEGLGVGFDYYNNVLKRLSTMAISDLNNVAARYFTTEKMARIRVGRVS